MNKILEEFENLKEQHDSEKVSFYLKIFSLFAIVVGFGIYVGDILFGKSSLDVLFELQSEKQILEQNIKVFKQNNAILQKEYFELKNLDPDYKGF
ncbi:MAG: septum formation initiator [Sulfurospirillum sp.]|nr:septum formation initiator [Sulfurospirillum sp.]MBL0702920.1 septum formation initiator [Sulfurospirillum sp.]